MIYTARAFELEIPLDGVLIISVEADSLEHAKEIVEKEKINLDQISFMDPEKRPYITWSPRQIKYDDIKEIYVSDVDKFDDYYKPKA